MTLFEQYGIKEVADVTLYSIHKKEDGSGQVYYVPALYLDTLKVSTTEKTAENTWAEGGLGNSRLINWDYGKTINVNLEDALCTPASLGLCWNGILSADWKNGQIEFNSDTDNSIQKISRMEKARSPRQGANNTISHLLPKIKADRIDDDLGILKISSVVDGTDIRGFGAVKGRNYKWKMAIESAVKSIAVVPDRFFDVTGKSYPIDWDRKVSVHSLPDYENYKDAIIYKINNRGRFIVPPLAKIIFDAAQDDQGEIRKLRFVYDEEMSAENNYKPSIKTFAQLLNHTKNGVKDVKGYEVEADTKTEYVFNVYEEDIIASTSTTTSGTPPVTETNIVDYYFPLRGNSIEITPTIGYRKYSSDDSITVVGPDDYLAATPIYVLDSVTDLTAASPSGLYYFVTPAEAGKNWQIVNNQEPRSFEAKTVGDITGTYLTNKKDYAVLADIENLTADFIVADENNFYYYDIIEPCYKVSKGTELYSKIIGSSLREITEELGTSLAEYLWNHKVDMMDNSTGIEKIDTASYSRAIEKCDYLAIVVDNNDNYIPLMGVAIDVSKSGEETTTADIGLSVAENFQDEEKPNKSTVLWFNPCPAVDISQFKGIDMWLRFQSINEMIYFMITKYEDDIISIKAATTESPEGWKVNKKTTSVNENTGLEAEKVEGRLWAYINPRTMKPYDDDYWFHKGEPYYIKSLTLAPADKTISGKRITITADQWPGMYMMVGETLIRSRDTGEDMRLQIRIPLCKVRSDQTLTLEAGGDPTTFNLALEVAQPQSGELMEITAYDVRTRMVQGENGQFYAIDGSSEVVIE